MAKIDEAERDSWAGLSLGLRPPNGPDNRVQGFTYRTGYEKISCFSRSKNIHLILNSKSSEIKKIFLPYILQSYQMFGIEGAVFPKRVIISTTSFVQRNETIEMAKIAFMQPNFKENIRKRLTYLKECIYTTMT